MERRTFNATLAGLGLALGGGHVRAQGAATPANVQTFLLAANDWVPNNQKLPVIVYRNALPVAGDDPGSAFEDLFERNGWPPQWRNGVYPFHHYHTLGHEVLGFYGGSARLMLGGPGGREVSIKAGDIVLLPAGTGHKKLEADADFAVVGAYPPGQEFDIVRQAPDGVQRARLLTLPFPASDPVAGMGGPVTKEWHYS
ncbi:cupin [Acetobacter sp. TBRC 12305]|uniref:Cupin n=1 Tax=Acetobacter garciniae TaxID=2817435 RepID=A0A939KN33_9PROT|nr:cupin [Acetobacter garciniae]MBO1325225.1 cupin [Acetobacter garciniae]MBX0344803.1 cupin [Acetobacter garciniae]